MKAARWHAVRDIRIDDIPEPTPRPGQVKIKVSWCGICGTDLHRYASGPVGIPVDEPHPLTNERAPVGLGHEFSGEITELGEGVKRLKLGDRVVVEPILACGKCGPCRQGKYNVCDLRGFLGGSGGGGAFAPYIVADEHMTHLMPAGLSYEQGALVEPAAVALHAVRQSSLKAGDTAAVFGAGPIGLLVVQALRAAGASSVHVVEISPQRAAKALELGAQTAIDPTKEDPVARLHTLTGGGVDVAFELTGAPNVLQQCVDSTHYAGETIIVALASKPPTFDPNTIVRKERVVRGIMAYRDVFPAVMDLMTKGYFQADQVVTKRIALDDLVKEGFETLVHDKQHIKILVQPPH